jgi:hypothetical protein
METLSEVKLFSCSCYAHALYVQRIERDLHIDYFISYRPDPADRVEDYYIQIPLSKNDRISTQMLALMNDDLGDNASINISFENEYSSEQGPIIKKYTLTISRTHNMYNLLLTRTDLCAEDDAFVWEWSAYRDKWIQLGLFIEQLEDELDDELYS